MTWRSDTCKANEIKIHYLRTGGDKPPIVMLHGLLGSGACWSVVMRVLTDAFDIIAPDARGHGDSSAPLDGYRYDDLAADVISLLDALELSRPILLGHSMGGMTAAVVASRAPHLLRGLVLVDPTFLTPQRQREVHASDVAEQHRQTLQIPKSEIVAQAHARSPHRPRELIELQAEARLKTCLRAFDVLVPPNPDYRLVMGAVDVPTLLVIGDRNPVVTHEMAMELRHLNAHMWIEQITDAGHGLPFDQPERLGEVVMSFLRSLTPSK